MPYNGARWFDGPSPANNEITADPISGRAEPGPDPVNTALVNSTGCNERRRVAGVIVGLPAAVLHHVQPRWRNMERPSPAPRAADYNVYWGAAGKVDSVIDVTHNVVVPFQDHPTVYRGGWGFLNTVGAGAGLATTPGPRC